MLPPSERTVRGQRGGIIELPYIADPRLQRARPPTDLEIAAAHVTSPSFLGMPPHIFKRIAEYVLLYEQPEELVQKPIHRRMVEVTKAHVLTVSSEKVVRSGNKQVARNLNTASLTNFFLVCRHFRDVGVKLYYGLNTFRFSSDDNMHGWAKAIGSRRKFVRSIQLDSHWEVQFRNGEISPEALRIVCDHGIISSTAFGMFRNLQKVHLSIGCALECHHDAFQQQHGQLDSHIEGFCWGVASQQAGYMCQALRDDELRSRTVDLSHYLIFDGAFVVGKSNRVDYHARMKDFVWKMRAADAGLPKSRQLSYRGRGSLLPGPRLPNTPAIVAPAPTGAWSQPFVNDESIFSDSSRFGLVYVHDHSAADWSATVADWSAIADDLRAPRRIAAVQAMRARRTLWRTAVAPEIHAAVELRTERARRSARAAVMSEVKSSQLPAQFLERISARAQWAAVADEVTSMERRVVAQARHARQALWTAIHPDLRAQVVQRAAINASLAEEAAAEAARREAVARSQGAAAGQGMRRTLLNARR